MDEYIKIVPPPVMGNGLVQIERYKRVLMFLHAVHWAKTGRPENIYDWQTEERKPRILYDLCGEIHDLVFSVLNEAQFKKVQKMTVLVYSTERQMPTLQKICDLVGEKK